jgi:hypothetical protein
VVQDTTGKMIIAIHCPGIREREKEKEKKAVLLP